MFEVNIFCTKYVFVVSVKNSVLTMDNCEKGNTILKCGLKNNIYIPNKSVKIK